MKLVLCFVLLVCAVALPVDSEFVHWAKEHNKGFENAQARATTLRRNKELVAALEANEIAGEGVLLSATGPFADMTAEEFSSKVLMPSRAYPLASTSKMASPLPTNDLPESFDWREKGAVTEVKDQGTVGSCWAFSTIGNVEGVWFNAGNKLVDLSPEQLVECDGTKDIEHSAADCGVFGGWPYLALQYIIGAGGVESESDYPYCVGTGDCYPCMAPGFNKSLCGPPIEYCNKTKWHCHQEKSVDAARISDWVAIDDDEDQIAAQLMSRGPLSVLLDATLLQFYHSGVWDSKMCNPKNLDHAVLLVGWGVDKSILGKEKPYWLVKNSWGKKWGQNGYFKIARGKGKCGINTAVVSGIV